MGVLLGRWPWNQLVVLPTYQSRSQERRSIYSVYCVRNT